MRNYDPSQWDPERFPRFSPESGARMEHVDESGYYTTRYTCADLPCCPPPGRSYPCPPPPCCACCIGSPCKHGDDACCACAAQMRFLISQIIELYPTSTVVISMENGSEVSGCPGTLLPEAECLKKAGIFQLVDHTGTPTEAVSICRIASIRITEAAYNPAIEFLPTPDLMPNDCGAVCEAAVRTYLPVGTTGVTVKLGGKTIGQGDVHASAFGILALVVGQGHDPTFVSTCKAEVLSK